MLVFMLLCCCCHIVVQWTPVDGFAHSLVELVTERSAPFSFPLLKIWFWKETLFFNQTKDRNQIESWSPFASDYLCHTGVLLTLTRWILKCLWGRINKTWFFVRRGCKQHTLSYLLSSAWFGLTFLCRWQRAKVAVNVCCLFGHLVIALQ